VIWLVSSESKEYSDEIGKKRKAHD